MRTTIAIALLLLAPLAGCKRAPDGPKTAAGWRLTEFRQRDGNYSCLAPGEWRVHEDAGSSSDVMFFGPERVSLAIARYPEGDPRIKTPQDYAASVELAGKPIGGMSERRIGERTVYRVDQELEVRQLHGKKTLYTARESTLLVPVQGSLYAFTHSAPVETWERSYPVLEAAVESFRLLPR